MELRLRPVRSKVSIVHPFKRCDVFALGRGYRQDNVVCAELSCLMGNDLFQDEANPPIKLSETWSIFITDPAPPADIRGSVSCAPAELPLFRRLKNALFIPYLNSIFTIFNQVRLNCDDGF